jgi:hypothetical protein
MQRGARGLHGCWCCCMICSLLLPLLLLLLPGVLPETFNSVAPSILRVLSNLAGVSDPWSLFGLAPLTTVTGVTPSGRHLLQSPGQVIGVRALYLMNTTSSKLVAFRLAQPLGTAGGGTSSDTGCRTVLCQQLVAAGVPVDVSSILVVPDGLGE